MWWASGGCGGAAVRVAGAVGVVVMGGWWVIGGWWWVAGRRVGVLGGVMGVVLGAGWCWGELDQVGWCLFFRV